MDSKTKKTCDSFLEKSTIQELVAFRELLDQAIEAKQAEAQKELVAKFQTEAESLGLSLSDILENMENKPKRKIGKAKPKYRNPDNQEQTWSGRGRMPNWLTAIVGDDREKAEEYRIPEDKG